MTATAPTLRARLYALLRYSDPTPGARQVRVAHLIVLGIGLFAVILLSVDELHGQRPAGPAHHHLDRHVHLPRRIPGAPVGRAGDAALRPGLADQGAAALGGVDPGADRPAGRPAGLHVRRRLRHHRRRRRLGLLHPLDPQGRPACAGLQHARPRRLQRARADRQRADPVRHPADDCRHRRAHAGTRAPTRAVRLAARRHVVGGGHSHDDGLRRRRAAHARRAPDRFDADDRRHRGAGADDRRARHRLRPGRAAARVSSGVGAGRAGAAVRLAGRRHPVGDRGQAAHALLPAAHHRGAARRCRRFDVLHLERRGRGPPAQRRLGAARRRRLLRRDGPARAPAARRRRCRRREPTTLLVLYASDFYEIASHIPKLAEAVEVEAQRRREENLERQAAGRR